MSIDVAQFQETLGTIWGAHDPDQPLAELLSRGVTGEPQMLIGGELVQARSGRTYDNVNPATEQVLGAAADAGAEDVEAALEAAREAFDETTWSTDHEFRSRCLLQLHAALAKRADEFRALAVSEIGVAVRTSYGFHSDMPILAFQYWAEVAASYEYEHAIADQAWTVGTHRVVRREPVGVVAAITPWNYPFWTTATKIAPALAAGCTVVLKAAPQTPWYATLLAKVVAEETDIPGGVFNVITTSDNAVAELLTTDPRVDLVHFTGSTAIGRRILANASHRITNVSLELGGKSANIVLDDMPMELVVPVAAGLVTINSGQGCVLPTRLLVPRNRYDEAVDLASEAYRNISYGDPTRPETFQGPQISRQQQDRILAYVRKGVADGARLAVGGGIPDDQPVGYYVEPTLFVDVDPASTIAQQEIFGPVLCLMAYEDTDEAVRIANNSDYGLAGGVFSTDEDRALGVARRIRSGMISVNGGNYFSPDLPAGGYKQSGLGRESGIEGFEEFLETKSIAIAR